MNVIKKICIIGTGFSGICMGIKLKEAGIEDFVLLEKSGEVGGTWRENTYPGAECDVPSALYSYSFEPYPFWEYKWSHQPQILEYLKHCTKKHDLYSHIHFNRKMVSAKFLEDNGSWVIETVDGTRYESQILISAVGQLHHPSIPKIEGQDKFKGISFHSANWNHSISLKGKKVGVIGNAASAIQFIPQITKEAGSVSIFQRSANWMFPKFDRPYKEWEKKLARIFPSFLKLYRFTIWLKMELLLYMLMGNNKLFKKFGESITINYINKIIKNGELKKKLIPDYRIGAKRILFSDNYYETLNNKNIEVIVDSINRITQKGVVTSNNEEKELDVIIYATGFKTNPFLYQMDVKGLGGKSIHETWSSGAEAYLGIMTAGFPNLFMMYGPNTNLGHSSIVIMIESQTSYIIQCIKTIQDKNLKYMDVKKVVQDAYNVSIQKRLKSKAWNTVSKSWYKVGNRITNNWPGRTIEYIKQTKHLNLESYLLYYRQ